ncbi:Rpn family recombination-promoting nuclease/putative transposase, partial [Klebsiella pneumoniae]
MDQQFAKAFVPLYLRAPCLAICDLDSLQLVYGSFVEEDLRDSYSDILYSLRKRHGQGYVYALIEHQ